MGQVPVYEVALEGVSDGQGLVEAMDRALSSTNVEYASKRESGRLGAPRARVVASGTFARYREVCTRLGAPEGQVKDPIIALDEEAWTKVVGQ